MVLQKIRDGLNHQCVIIFLGKTGNGDGTHHAGILNENREAAAVGSVLIVAQFKPFLHGKNWPGNG